MVRRLYYSTMRKILFFCVRRGRAAIDAGNHKAVKRWAKLATRILVTAKDPDMSRAMRKVLWQRLHG